jgi:hypothetical protein
MKYLKRFNEGYNKSEYYTDLGLMNSDTHHEELRNLYYQTRDCVVSKRDADVINSLLKGEWEPPHNDRKKVGGFWLSWWSWYGRFSSTGTHPCIWERVSDFQSLIKFEIFALPDEWFLVLERVKSGDGINRLYKCDQLEGVIELLKDKKLIDENKAI